jgi:hypothetical protein
VTGHTSCVRRHPAVGARCEAVVGERRARAVAHEVLEGVALRGVLGGDAETGVQVEGFVVGRQGVSGARRRTEARRAHRPRWTQTVLVA